MARGLSKNTQGLKSTTQQSVATSEPGSKSAQPTNSRITPLASAELFCAGTVFLVALLLYSWTLAPTVTLTDSGELIIVARGLGIAHPPGVPLWIILAHLASLVPFGNIAVRINFSSALFAALACAMLTLTMADLTITASYLATSKRRKRVAQQSKTAEESGLGRLLLAAPALVAVYAYLPLAASRSPVINWGHPRSLQEIWWHITGRQYQVYFSFKPEIMGEQFAEFCRMALREFGFPWLPLSLVLAFAGFVDVFKRDRTTFWFLLTIIIADLAYALSYEIAEDKDAYYLPTFISIAIAAGLGIRWMIRRAVSKPVPAGKLSVMAGTVVLLVCAITLAANWPFNNRRQYFIAHDYVENLLSTIAPNSLLLTLDWQVASPMLYAQEIEQRRRDVKVVDINLLRRSWYFDYLNRAYPGLVERSRDKIEAFVQNLKEWERDPGAFARSPMLTQRISATFLEMIQAMVTNESRVAPVYMTNDLLSSDSVNGELTRWLTQKYQLVPQGLVFNLADGQGFHDSPDVHLQIRGLADGTLRFAKGDPVNVKVIPVYTNMLINRGRYLALFGQHERAIAAFEQALALNPDLALARQGLAESTAKARRP